MTDTQDLERGVRDVCEWLGWWKPGQMCHGKMVRTWTLMPTDSAGMSLPYFACNVCGFEFESVIKMPAEMPTHEKPLPELDDALAMRVLRELGDRGHQYSVTPPTVKLQEWTVWSPRANEPNSFGASPAEAIIRAAAALARQEKGHSGGTANGR